MLQLVPRPYELVRDFEFELQEANSISICVKVFAVAARLRPDFIGIEPYKFALIETKFAHFRHGPKSRITSRVQIC